MSARILYGKEFAAKIKESAQAEVEKLKKDFGVTPGLTVIIVGEIPRRRFTFATSTKLARSSE